MASTELQFDTLDRQNLQVMRAYSARESAARASRDDHDGWLDRFDQVAGLEPRELTQIHGRLIALGMLRFELASRSVGLRYQISQRGKAALESAERHEVIEAEENPGGAAQDCVQDAFESVA